jgi:acetoacetyl-CoA synthetase
VHGAGNVLLQHFKELSLHTDITSKDVFFYFTTTGWMMWNWHVSGLLTGARLVLYEGSPVYPDLNKLWKLIEEEEVSVFGTSAKYISTLRNAGEVPKKNNDLKSLKTILSTGSPLLPEDFDWVYENVKKEVRLSSISGGTDIVSCFVLGNPILPVIRGEIQCKGLGVDVRAFDENGNEVKKGKGELVCVKPIPSMPVSFWNDPDGKKYKAAYFETFPEVWAHGDFVVFTESGGVIIYGRSDATLNPGGVRIGTAEIYRQVETLKEVKDSLAVAQKIKGDEQILLFVVLNEKVKWSKELEKKIKDQIRKRASPRHVPARIIPVKEIPYTYSGKKVELAVAQALRGEKVKNLGAISNGYIINELVQLAKMT